MNLRHHSLAVCSLLATLVTLAAAGVAGAQQRFGSQQNFGQGGFNQGGFNQGGSGQNGFGGPGGFGQGGFGSQGGFGQGGFGAQGGFGQGGQSSFGGGFGQDRFGSNRAGNQSRFNNREFVGGGADNARDAFRSLNPRELSRSFAQEIENQNDLRRSRRRDRDRRRENADRPQVHVRLVPAFEDHQLSRQPDLAVVQERLRSMLESRGLDGAVQLSEGRVTLSGTVTSERERKLAETLARLEPGVSEVDNQLMVAGSEPIELLPPTR